MTTSRFCSTIWVLKVVYYDSEYNAYNNLFAKKERMKKTIRKHIFTEDLTKYRNFLRACDFNMFATAAMLKNELTAHQYIEDLISIYTETGELSLEKMEALVKTSCPDFGMLQGFQNLQNATTEDRIEDVLDDTGKNQVVINCAGIPCETCWKNYINQIAREINQSAIDIKLYTLPEEEPDDR